MYAVLFLLDLSSAFDTEDYSIVYRQLHFTLGLNGPVLGWFHSYLHGCSQYVRRGLQSLCSLSAESIELLYGTNRFHNVHG